LKKIISDESYKILFDLLTGVEILTGINGHPDPFVLKYPSMIDIGIMGHCLNKCRICYQGDKHEPNMTLDDFKRIMEESKKLTNQVALGGRGDPNLHEDFIEIIKFARENGVVPNYTTSGINLTDEQVEATKKYCGAVAVSDYGTEHTFRALKKFMDAGMKTNIHFVVTKKSFYNVMLILKGYDPWDGKVDLDRLNAVVFLLFKQQGSGLLLEDHKPTDDQTRLFSKAIKSPKSKFKIGMDSCMMNKVLQHRELTRLEMLCADTCEAGRMSMYITSDMKLLPCSFGDHDLHGIPFSGDNMRRIQSVWKHGGIFNDFRQILEDDPGCCPYEKLWMTFKEVMAE